MKASDALVKGMVALVRYGMAHERAKAPLGRAIVAFPRVRAGVF
jgi:hypothetical protein